VAFGLGIPGMSVGLVAGMAPGVLAWDVAEWELRRIARGTAHPGGCTYALAARIMGMICTEVLVLIVLASLYFGSIYRGAALPGGIPLSV